MKESKLFRSLLATFVVIVFSGPAVVLADTISYIEVGKASVSYADLNLNTEKGVYTLYRRLQRASNEVSGFKYVRQTGTVRLWVKARQSYHNALSSAVEKIDNERLSEIHAG